MHQSIITSKGQTTIPKKVRELLNLKPNDRLFYLIEGGKVVLKPLQGNILELRGSVPHRESNVDLETVRSIARKKISERIVQGE